MFSIEGAREVFHQLVDHAEDVIFIIDRSMGIQCLNKSKARSFEGLPGEGVGTLRGSLFRGTGCEGLNVNARGIFESGEPASYEEKLLHGDREVWFDTRLTPITDQNGKPLAVLGISRDITERKQREELIAHSRREWLKAVDGMPYLLAVAGRDHRIERVNQAMASRLGSTVRDAIGLTCYEKLHGAKEPPSFCPLLPGFNVREATMEIVESHLGRGCLGCVSPIRNGGDQVVGCLYIARDVSHMDRNLDARRSSEEYMRMLLKSAEYTVYVQDPEGKYVSFSAMPGERIPWDVIGRTPFEFFEPSVASRLVERVKRVAVKGKGMTEQVEIGWRGETLQFYDKVSPVSDALGRVKAVATISMKVAEFRRSEMDSPAAGSGLVPAIRPTTLTPREREVLRLLARGLTSDQIAAALEISRKTVETHRARIMQKLDIHKAPALVSYAAKYSLL